MNFPLKDLGKKPWSITESNGLVLGQFKDESEARKIRFQYRNYAQIILTNEEPWGAVKVQDYQSLRALTLEELTFMFRIDKTLSKLRKKRA